MVSSRLDVCASPEWMRVIDAVAKSALGPDDKTGHALAEDVAKISKAYTIERGDDSWTKVPRGRKALAARLRFFFVRDWMKAGLPIAELARAGTFEGKTSLRVLDLGAGLGATMLGAAHGLAKTTRVEHLEVLATDDDRDALDTLRVLVEHATRDEATTRDLPRIDLETRAIDFFTMLSRVDRPYDLILAGFVWNELAQRTDLGSLIRLIEKNLAPRGAFIILEPALFETTQALESMRDAFVATNRWSALAPCTHDAPCPMRHSDGKHEAAHWCHASLPLALPEPTANIAREAGLRYERLSFAYVALGERIETREPYVRVVSDELASKGKTERLACGAGGLVRHRLLDREITNENKAFNDSERGDAWRLSALEARIRPDVRVERIARAWPARTEEK